MKKIYNKPELEILVLSEEYAVLQETSWGVNGEGNNGIKDGDGTDIGAGGADFDAKGWTEWDD